MRDVSATRDQPFDADFLVIGSGFGGAVAALRLAEKGYRVVVLEQGRRWRPRDFPGTNRSLHRYLWAPRLGFGGIQALTFLRHALVLHGTGVGGGSLVYANTLVRPPPEVFAAPGWAGKDWPGRLAPHYAEARRMLGATECPGLGTTDVLLQDVVDDLPGAGPVRTNPVGVFFGTPGEEVDDPYFGGEGPRRTGCTRCGACMIGCRVGAKNTLDQNYLWLAERRGVRVVPETRAVCIRDEEGGFTVETRRSLGPGVGAAVWRAREVVVAGGVLGTVRLLAESRRRGGLPRVSSRLGDRVGTNSEAILAADTPDRSVDFGDHVAITSGVQADEDTLIEMVRYNRGSDALFLLTAPLDADPAPPQGGLRRLFRGVRLLLQAVGGLQVFGRARRTAIVLAMQPTHGYLRLRLTKGPFGRRRLGSQLSPGGVPPAGEIPVATEVTRRLARSLGGRAWQSLWTALFGAPATAHILGGCPMALSAEEGVVDDEGRLHGHPGVRVVDGSVLPGNLGVNPSLTITALAEYFMSRVPPALDESGAGADHPAPGDGVQGMD